MKFTFRGPQIKFNGDTQNNNSSEWKGSWAAMSWKTVKVGDRICRRGKGGRWMGCGEERGHEAREQQGPCLGAGV